MRNKPDAVLAAFDALTHLAHAPTHRHHHRNRYCCSIATGPANAPTPLPAACCASGHQRAGARRASTDVWPRIFGGASGIGHRLSESRRRGGRQSEPPKIGMFGKRSPSPAAWIQPEGGQRALEAKRARCPPAISRPRRSFGWIRCMPMPPCAPSFPNGTANNSPRLGVGRHEHEERLSAAQSDPATYRHPQRGDHGYEVIASNLRPELNKFYYAAVSVKFDEEGAGTLFT